MNRFKAKSFRGWQYLAVGTASVLVALFASMPPQTGGPIGEATSEPYLPGAWSINWQVFSIVLIASFILVTLAVTGAIKRALTAVSPEQRRKKRGLCPKCTYDLRGEFDIGCSECGWRGGDRG